MNLPKDWQTNGGLSGGADGQMLAFPTGSNLQVSFNHPLCLVLLICMVGYIPSDAGDSRKPCKIFSAINRRWTAWPTTAAASSTCPRSAHTDRRGLSADAFVPIPFPGSSFSAALPSPALLSTRRYTLLHPPLMLWRELLPPATRYS